MEQNQKICYNNFRRFFLLLVSVALMVITSCQKDEFLFDSDSDKIHGNFLKSSEIAPGKYVGDYEGGEWLIALPPTWNNLETRYIIFYAHGMVDPVPYEPVKLPADSINDKPIEDIVTDMDMGYATTSYRDNGIIVLEAVEDIKNLVDEVNYFFQNEHPEYYPPDIYFLGGPSEGGLVTVKTIEKYQHLFDGAISICGPIGSFYDQLQYNGDFHVLFNYFFGSVLKDLGISLGNPKDGVDPLVMQAWKSGDLQNIIANILMSNPNKVKQLIKCANLTVDISDPLAVGTAILELLRFNIMLTNDVKQKMNGVPYNNKYKWYMGSDNDWLLNRSVQRILDSSYNRARKIVNQYETSGNIAIPLVTIHTTGDHITPFWHNPKYRFKILLKGNSLLHTGIPVLNYGHCTIEESHVMAAIAIIITKISISDYFKAANLTFESSEHLNTFKEILKENSIQVDLK